MRTLRPTLGIIVLFLGLATQGSAMASKRTDDSVALRGVIRVVGNEPFTHVVLTVTGETEGKSGGTADYLIRGPLANELRLHYQMRQVTLKGSLCASSKPGFTKCLEPTTIEESGRGQ